jgi:hypothetical protein
MSAYGTRCSTHIYYEFLPSFIACSLVIDKKSQNVTVTIYNRNQVFNFILKIESVSVSFYFRLALPSVCHFWKLPDCYLPVSATELREYTEASVPTYSTVLVIIYSTYCTIHTVY